MTPDHRTQRTDDHAPPTADCASGTADRAPRTASWAQRLLRASVSDAAFDSIAGDLDEGARRGRGALWYSTMAIRSIAAHWIGQVPVATEIVGAAARRLRRQPMYVMAVTGTLALAVATATASAVVVKRAFFDAVPYPHADRLVSLLTMVDGSTSAVSAAVYQDMRAAGAPFDLMAPIRPASPVLSTDEATSSLIGSQVTADYFELLGVRPAYGQVWSGSPAQPVAVISWRLFEDVLGGNPAAIGRPLVLDGVSRAVIGVLPRDFHPPYWVRADVWMPLDLEPLAREPRGRRQLTILARRSTSTEEASAAAFLTEFSARMQAEHPTVHGRQAWTARSLQEEFTAQSRPALIGLAAGAALLVLIVCANIGGLSGARALGLQHQATVRRALGAGETRLFVEQFAESVCLATVGTGAGLAIAPMLVSLAATHQREFLERVTPFALDGSVVLLALVTGMVAGTAAALMPARLLAPSKATDALRAARAATGSRTLTIARHGLVIAQIAFALVLVVGAGLLIRTVQHLTRQSTGFVTDGMTSFSVTMPGARFASQAQQLQVEEDVLARLRLIPGVESATSSIGLPAGAAMGASLHIEGRPTTGGLPEVGYTSVTPGFFRQMGVPLESGRDLSTADTSSTPGAILINASMAKQHWPNGNAIGARIYLGPGRPDPGAWMHVVGIVGDVRQAVTVDAFRPTAYGSTRQYSWPRRFFTVYAPSRPGQLDADIRAAVRAADPAISVGALQHLPEVFAAQQGRHRLVMSVLTIFSLVSLLLCGSGLYAVIAMASQLRRREYAIRMALGAHRQHVRWQVARQAVVLAGSGVVLGIAVALLGVRAIGGLLHGVAPGDLGTFVVSAMTLAILAGLAAWWPARQAARVNPVDALKVES